MNDRQIIWASLSFLFSYDKLPNKDYRGGVDLELLNRFLHPPQEHDPLARLSSLSSASGQPGSSAALKLSHHSTRSNHSIRSDHSLKSAKSGKSSKSTKSNKSPTPSVKLIKSPSPKRSVSESPSRQGSAKSRQSARSLIEPIGELKISDHNKQRRDSIHSTKSLNEPIGELRVSDPTKLRRHSTHSAKSFLEPTGELKVSDPTKLRRDSTHSAKSVRFLHSPVPSIVTESDWDQVTTMIPRRSRRVTHCCVLPF